MSYSQALEQQLKVMRAMHRPMMQEYAIESMGDESSGRRYLQEIHDAAEIADPYYWAPEIVDVIDGVWREMPEWTLRREALESAAGFFWFARPFDVPCPSECDDTPHVDRLSGLLWGIDDTLAAKDASGVVWIVPVIDDDHGIWTGRSIPWFLGWTRSRMIGQWPQGGPLAEHNDAVGKIFASCVAFMEQRIFVSSHEPAARATRKRAVVALKHEPLIRIVELRRRQRLPTLNEHGEPPDWSCRWVVSGHWRRQFYPSDRSHRPVFVLPYVKGPEGKPLRPPRAKVFAVVR